MSEPYPEQLSVDPHARVVEDYRSRGDEHARAESVASRAASWTSRARLIVFLATVGIAGVLSQEPRLHGIAWGVAIIGGATFFVLVRRHRRLAELVRVHTALRRACETGVNRVVRAWESLTPVASITYEKRHAFAGDLHLSGEKSLMHLLGPVSAGYGRDVLAEWLLAESPPARTELDDRQAAVAELAPLADWRERLGVHAKRAGGKLALEGFLAWAEGDGWLRGQPALVWSARVLGLLTPIATVAAFANWIPGGIAGALIMLSITLTLVGRRRLTATLEKVSAREFSGRAYGAMFDHAQQATFAHRRLRSIQEEMGGAVAAPALDRLAQIATCADVRLSPMGYVVVQTFLLWDFHVVDALERWQREHGRHLRARIRALGELEAHASIATLSHDNPTWTLPVFADDNAPTVEATALAHPLLSPSTRVANDVTIGPPGTFLLVTGSNMAGKSTLLRSVALNVVLAQAGATVCAEAMRLPRVRLRTSIHVQDALEEGLSLFMVELLRLKAIVDAARERDATAPLLYIADEMLRGTNMQERRPAVAAVLHHLLNAGAIGAIATHDLELAAEPALASHARAVHLSEQFKESDAGPVMWFDYRVRPGLATSRNALKLLEIVGLGE